MSCIVSSLVILRVQGIESMKEYLALLRQRLYPARADAPDPSYDRIESQFDACSALLQKSKTGWITLEMTTSVYRIMELDLARFLPEHARHSVR